MTSAGLLASYRVLDLGGVRSFLIGRLFVLLGAEVIQVEPPGGGEFRTACELGSQYPLSWIAYGAGRRSVELDLETDAGRSVFLELADSADFLIDDGERLQRAGITMEQIKARNPWLIDVAMSGFGRRGYKRDYAESDLVLWAASGVPWQNGSEDEEPLRIAVPQAWLHAAADAAIGAMIAHIARLSDGCGQSVRVSVLKSTMTATLAADLADFVGHPEFRLRVAFGAREEKSASHRRPLDLSGSGAASRRTSWQALDGEVELHLAMGPATGHFTNALFAWIAEEGGQKPGTGWDWTRLHERILAGDISDDDMEDARAIVRDFFATRTLGELAEATVQRRLLIAPCFDVATLAALPHFTARRVFGEVVDPAGRRFEVPQSFAWIDGKPMDGGRELPAVGEFDPSRDPRGPHTVTGNAGLPATPARLPLAGLRVVDLSWVVAGPMMGRVLADYGADVIRVESRKRPDPTRRMPPFYGGVEGLENTAIYQNVNLGKVGLTLDLSRDDARAVLLDLVRCADVIVESFAAGQMRKWGLDYAALREVNPAIIMVSTALAGQTGPWTKIAGFGNIGSALSGILRLVTEADGTVRGPVVPYTDFIAPRFGLFLLLAALDRKRRSGEGAHVDVSQVESGIHCIATAIASLSESGAFVAPLGNADPMMAPHGVFRCCDARDRHSPWVAIAVRDDRDWQALAGVMDRKDLASDPRYEHTAGRLLARDALDDDVAAWTARHDAQAVERMLQAAGVPAHIVASAADLAVDPHVADEGIFEHLADERLGTIVVEASRYGLSRSPLAPRRAAPTFGRDSNYVLATVLGYEADRIDKLKASGALQ